jgi:hypothetical protein
MFPLEARCTCTEALSCRIGGNVDWLARLLNVNPYNEIVLITGSIVEGLGNSNSDLDVFLVCKDGRPRKGNSIFFWQDVRRWVDVESIAISELERLTNTFTKRSDKFTEWALHRSPSLTDMDLYHRLLIGIYLTEWLDRTRKPIPLNKEALADELAYSALVAARARWTDAAGSFQSLHFGQASAAAEICLDHLVDAYTALLGETNPSQKWRHARLFRLFNAKNDPLGIWSHVYAQNIFGYSFTKDTARRHILLVSSLMFLIMQMFFRKAVLYIPTNTSTLTHRFEISGDRFYSIDVEGIAEAVDVNVLRPLRQQEDIWDALR